MNISKQKISVAVFYWVVFFISSNSFADVTVDVPLENPIYNSIERLSSLGIFASDIQSIRPVTIDRLQSLIDAVDETKLRNETVMRDVQTIKMYLVKEAQKNKPQFNAQFGALSTNARPTPILEINAMTNPLINTKDQAKLMPGGDQLWLQPRFYFNWENWAAFDIEPWIGMREDVSSGDMASNIYLRKTALKFGSESLEFSAGRMPIQWGHGFSGSLLFGGAQHPLDMIQLRNTTPAQLPSFLKVFGEAQFSIFLTQLDEDQVFPGSFVIGERLAIKPHPILELAFSQSIQLGGEGAPPLSFWDVMSELFGIRLQDINSVNLSNRNMTIDGSLKIPPLNYTKIYSELFWEDCCKYPFTRDLNKLFGISYPQLWNSRGLIAFEYVQTTEIYNRHGRYTSGFENRGVAMGHPLGPDAEGFYLRYHHVIAPTIEFDLVNAYEIRGRNQLDQKSEDIRNVYPGFENSEQRMRYAIKFQRSWRSSWSSIGFGYERLWNYQYISDQDRNQFSLSAETGFSF
jgi:hypothetical protein